MLLRLGLETGVHHAAADEDRLAAIDLATVDAYRDYLARVFGFEVAVEHALVGLGDLEAHVFKDRLRSMRLLEDLMALGLSEYELVRSPKAQVKVESAAQGLGWMFVLERQTLVAGIVRRHLIRTLGERVARASSYLHSAGDTPGARFRSFGQLLGLLARRYSPAAIVGGANDAFRAQRTWYARFAFGDAAIAMRATG